MNDTETLEWIAEHLVRFLPLFQSATMDYIGDDGMTRHLDFTSENPNPSTVELLRGCIGKATEAGNKTVDA